MPALVARQRRWAVAQQQVPYSLLPGAHQQVPQSLLDAVPVVCTAATATALPPPCRRRVPGQFVAVRYCAEGPTTEECSQLRVAARLQSLASSPYEARRDSAMLDASLVELLVSRAGGRGDRPQRMHVTAWCGGLLGRVAGWVPCKASGARVRTHCAQRGSLRRVAAAAAHMAGPCLRQVRRPHALPWCRRRRRAAPRGAGPRLHD